jgi:phosphoribosylformimino-5-aminoimidazole carboxamide ribotide isomerase
MKIIPVLDLLGGVVVRGVAGQRENYRPVVSRLVASSRPTDVALAFREHFGLDEIYVADLDAIAGKPAAQPTYDALHAAGFSLWLDAGIRGERGLERALEAGIGHVILGLETIPGPDFLARARRRAPERIVFSLDLNSGRALGDTSAWNGGDAWTIADQAAKVGARAIIVLDLSRVGTGGGTGTEELTARLARDHPELEIVAGGGVRHVEDLKRLQAIGVQGVLVASALHDGRLTRAEIEQLDSSFRAR